MTYQQGYRNVELMGSFIMSSRSATGRWRTLIFREKLDVPILTIEGDTPRQIDARTKIRLESFINMIAERKAVQQR